MPDYSIRLFSSEEAVRHVGDGLLVCTLLKSEWTHEAHLAASLWLLTERGDIHPETELPGIIRRYNVSVGGVNDDTQGYHETLTQLYIRGVRGFLKRCEEASLLARVNALLASEIAQRKWPLSFYSPDVLFSPRARREWVEPDLAPI